MPVTATPRRGPSGTPLAQATSAKQASGARRRLK